ncbi:MAG: ATP-dependent DNA helicase RecG [bacterium]|nr:ATP-dependent DNA helicase RecG [bacterium]
MAEAAETKVQYVKGVGPRRAAVLGALGISTVADLLRHYPRRYEDRSRIRPIAEVREGEEETVRGRVLALGTKRLRGGLLLFQAAVGDGSGVALGTWFNQPYLESRFKRGEEVILTGKARRRRGELQILSPEYEVVAPAADDALNTGRIVPVYPLTEGLSQRSMRAIMHACLDRHADAVPDLVPPAVREEAGLPAAAEALREIHFPADPASLERARRRIVFEEFLLMQVAIVLKRRQLAELPGSPKRGGGPLLAAFLSSLPFALTGAQRRALDEIAADMARERPMHRLLQGDVGSGKTVVAVAALLAAIDSGFQGALAAPTEILAEQHWRTLRSLAAALPVEVRLLTAGVPQPEREAALEAARSGRPAILVGTHALMEGEVAFDRLGLVVVDEQHRFGVVQRARLRGKGRNPDVLVMTATPIPRTLALTLYGDLDVSVLDEMPPGRGTVVTRRVPPGAIGKAYDFIRREASAGRQAYIVYPLVDESERLPLGAARAMAERLSREHFPGLRVGLVHGRMRREERESVMTAFREGRVHVLVATSVIEVGLDVPNACVMLVEHAERFGLAQLHQMRGRIGRGRERSYFLLDGSPATEEAARRLRALEETADGFRIAEIDLEIRGPGEFFSGRQHGAAALRLARLDRDGEVLRAARTAAERIADRDRWLRDPAHRLLRRELIRNYSGRFLLGTIG